LRVKNADGVDFPGANDPPRILPIAIAYYNFEQRNQPEMAVGEESTFFSPLKGIAVTSWSPIYAGDMGMWLGSLTTLLAAKPVASLPLLAEASRTQSHALSQALLENGISRRRERVAGA
jgi:hypothetical protein